MKKILDVYQDKKREIILIACMVVGALVFSLFEMNAHSFKGDELYTLGFIGTKISFNDMIKIFITDEVTNPPLYDIFMYFWYRMVPKTEFWLLIPSFTFFLIGLIVMCKLVWNFTGSFSAVFLVICLGWINPFSFGYLILNLRSYAMLFMFSSLVLYWYFSVFKLDNIKNRLILVSRGGLNFPPTAKSLHFNF
jgi:uncharacterized membrane protein